MAGPNQIPGPSAIRAPTLDLKNHLTVLTQLKETTETASRLRGDPNQSYVKLGELISAGIVKFLGGVISPGPKIGSGGSVTINVADSIQGDGSVGSPLELVGDASSPGANTYYGTNGSGTKGFYSLPAGLTSPLTTKGDIWVFSSANTREPVGADGTVLTADSTSSTGVKWAAAAGGAQFLKGAGWNSSAGAILLSLVVPIDIIIPQACTLQEVYIITSGGTGSCTITVLRGVSLAVPTSDITGGTSPAISSGTAYTNTSLTGWTTSFAQNDRIRLTLTASSVFTSVQISLRFQ